MQGILYLAGENTSLNPGYNATTIFVTTQEHEEWDTMVEKLSFKVKISYGVAAIGDACSYTVLGTFLMFFSAFPLGVSCAMLFSSVDASYGIKVAYYGIMVLIFWTAFSTFFIPYMALGAEVTNAYDERTSLRSTAYGFNIVGMVMGMVMPAMIYDVCEVDELDSKGWLQCKVKLPFCG